MHEIELKFVIPEHKVHAVKTQTQVKTAKQHTLDAYYFDTPEQILGNAGIALRIRCENGNWVQTIKAKGDGLAKRIEENIALDLPKRMAQANLSPDLSQHSDTVKTLLSSVMPLDELSHALTIKFATKVQRITREVKRFGNVVEIAFDEGKIVSGKKSTPICEIEFELLQGEVNFLIDTAQAWVKRHGLWYSTVSKAEAGSRLFADISHGRVIKSSLKAFRADVMDLPHINQAQFLRLVVQNCLQHLLPNLSEIASSDMNANASTGTSTKNVLNGNHVHQARVAMRRLRTALKHYHQFTDDKVIHEQIKAWQMQLKLTFNQLGNYRDLDILQSKTQPMLESLGGPKVSWVIDVKTAPNEAVTAKAFQCVLLQMIAFASNTTETPESNAAKPTLTRKLHKLFKTFSADSARFAELTNEQQHDVRKQLKQLRYLCEFASPVFKTKHINPKHFIKQLEPAQDVLGEFNDAAVGHAAYAQRTAIDPNAWFAVGYFLASEAAAATNCAITLQGIKHVQPFWEMQNTSKNT